jgi:hypothetical protein
MGGVFRAEPKPVGCLLDIEQEWFPYKFQSNKSDEFPISTFGVDWQVYRACKVYGWHQKTVAL